jgi:hypothetical protein
MVKGGRRPEYPRPLKLRRQYCRQTLVMVESRRAEGAPNIWAVYTHIHIFLLRHMVKGGRRPEYPRPLKLRRQYCRQILETSESRRAEGAPDIWAFYCHMYIFYLRCKVREGPSPISSRLPRLSREYCQLF